MKTQIWIALSGLPLGPIAKKRLGITQDLYTILQILSVCAFEKVPLAQAFAVSPHTSDMTPNRNQLSLFDF